MEEVDENELEYHLADACARTDTKPNRTKPNEYGIATFSRLMFWGGPSEKQMKTLTK